MVRPGLLLWDDRRGGGCALEILIRRIAEVLRELENRFRLLASTLSVGDIFSAHEFLALRIGKEFYHCSRAAICVIDTRAVRGPATED
jgi:hypothetical protein